MLKLYDLAGADSARRFSPYCWRIKMALAHKGLEYETIPWRFTEKSAIAPYGSPRVPVLIDGDRSIVESFAIADYLEETYPDRPSLFGCATGRAHARFINAFADSALVMGLVPFLALDIFNIVDPADKDYFRATREARFNRSLEEIVADRDARVDGFRKTLTPLRVTLKDQPFVGGNAPSYADYILFGPFQWARCTSPFHLLETDDPIYAWRERMLDLFDGLARNAIGFPV